MRTQTDILNAIVKEAFSTKLTLSARELIQFQIALAVESKLTPNPELLAEARMRHAQRELEPVGYGHGV